MGTVVIWVLALLGVLLLIVARNEIARAWTPGERLPALAATVLVAGGVFAETTVVGSPATVRQLTAVAFVGIVVVASLVSTTPTIPYLGRRLAPVLWALGLWAWLFIVDAVQTFDHSPSTVIARTVSGLLLVVLLFGQTRLPLRAHHFTSAALLTVGILLATLPLLPRPLGSCTIFKCSEIGVILVGPFSSGNYFGIELSITAALALTTIVSARVRVFVVGTMLVALYATNARTSLFAVATGTILYLAASGAERRRTSTQLREKFGGILLLIAAAIAPLVGLTFILTADPTAFSNRGHIWNLGVAAVGPNGLTGIGIDMWTELQRIGAVSYLFTHSEYMLLYFSGGIIAIALFVCWLASAMAGARLGLSLARAMTLPLVFAVLGVLEVVWNPLTVDGLSWHAVAICCIAMPAVIERSSRFHRFASPALSKSTV